MKLLGLLILLLAFYGNIERSDAGNTIVGQQLLVVENKCPYNAIDVTLDYQRSLETFAMRLFRKLILRNNYNHFVYDPLSAWLSLAALAEGSDGTAKEELLLALDLPEDRCIREKYYQLALQKEISGNDVNFAKARLMVFDENISVNLNWANDVSNKVLLNTVSLPIKQNPNGAVTTIRQLLGARIPSLNLKGNSILLNSLDTQMLWTEAFSDAIIQASPFFNDFGEQIGTVDMMRMKKYIRTSYHPREQLRIIELPVGYNSRYRFLIGMSLESTTKTISLLKDTLLFDVLKQLELSKVPIEIAIPRFVMASEIDLRSVLEDMGLKRLWTDPAATRNISEPAAVPSGLFQRVTVVFDKAGVNPNAEDLKIVGQEYDGKLEDPNFGREFIANKPFIAALFDAEAYSIMFGTIFSKPTNNFLNKK